MRDVIFFALAPRRLEQTIAVGTAVDNRRDVVTKAVANLLARLRAALIFDRIVQQCGDGFIFRTAVFEDDAGDCQQMGDVRCLRAFA